MSKSVKSTTPFSAIAGGFVANIQALRVFTERLGQHADQHDREAVQRFLSEMERLMPDHFSVGITAEKPPHDGVKKARRRRKSDASQVGAPDASSGGELKLDPATSVAVIKAAKLFNKEAPHQGALLRRSALITAISHFEALTADLVHAFYVRFPGALAADQRSLTLSELRELGSLDDAVQHLISQEVDVLLRESLDKQVAYFKKPLSVDISPVEVRLPSLVEISQRRNVYVHNRGLANRHYIKKVSEELIGEFGVKEGEPLPVSEDYLVRAIDIVFLAGLSLLTQCWQKWEKAKPEERDSFLVNVTYESLQEGRFHVACEVASYALASAVKHDERRRILLINQAIALRSMQKLDEMRALLSTLDWSATALKFRLALAALCSNEDEFFVLLPKAVAAEEIGRDELEEWPLFEAVRGSRRFQSELDRLLPKPSATEMAQAPNEDA